MHDPGPNEGSGEMRRHFLEYLVVGNCSGYRASPAAMRAYFGSYWGAVGCAAICAGGTSADSAAAIGFTIASETPLRPSARSISTQWRKASAKWAFVFSAALSVAATPLSSIAQTQLQPNIAANAFLALCTPQSPSYQACVSYVVGYTDGLGFTNAALEKLGRKPLYCMPSTNSNLTGAQMVDMLLAYVERHPHHRHEFISTLIIDAFKEAWPCP
jgi:hypothetical protein